ncbi:hypothetical protein QE152_g3557 [Popillia japonica]|uniref:Uncharacterized protein n=1 Tax=Popillia japonica TaxID=7064 RepID=A0AAW1N3S6_POPJA
MSIKIKQAINSVTEEVINPLKSEISKLHANNSDFAHEITKLANEIAKLETENCNLKAEINNLKARTALLSKQEVPLTRSVTEDTSEKPHRRNDERVKTTGIHFLKNSVTEKAKNSTDAKPLKS